MSAPGSARAPATSEAHAREVQRGERFEFGSNWARFLATLDANRIRQAERSLDEMLGAESLRGARFLDAGSGSGLFSLAARQLGANVHSFDFDPQSVACTRTLRERFAARDGAWEVEEGSVLDPAFLAKLGRFDVVYSWGVLHHTGAMWQALDNVATLVTDGGRLFIALYNDQGGPSRRWLAVKKLYNRLPAALRPAYVLGVMGPRELRFFFGALVRGRPGEYVSNIRGYARRSLRGMSYWHDLVDWAGGYPFEVAKPEEVFEFLRARGFELERLVTCAGGLGCNQFVFRRVPA